MKLPKTLLHVLPPLTVLFALGSLYAKQADAEARAADLAKRLIESQAEQHGATVPRTTRATRAGGTVVLGAGTEATELVFLSPTCPSCVTMAPKIRAMEPSMRRVIVATNAEGLDEFLAEFDLQGETVVLDSGDLQDTLRVEGTPSRVVLDRQGHVVLDDPMTTVWIHHPSAGLAVLPDDVESALHLALGARALPGTDRCQAMPLDDSGRDVIVYEGAEGLTGFGRVLRRDVADPWSSNLEVFVVLDRDGALVSTVPLRPHRHEFVDVSAEDFQARWLSTERQPTVRGDLFSAFDAEAASLRRAVGLKTEIDLRIAATGR